jgi:spoIIIJ-associated protein
MEEKEKKAISYLEEILGALGLPAEIKADTNDEGLFLEVEGEGMGLLIGKDGSTLSAVEFILNIITNKGSEDYLRVSVDAEGYKDKKKMRIEQNAVDAAERVEQEKAPVDLGVMTPYERRIVHLTLRENTAVRTESEGEDPQRHIIVKPL